MLDAEVLLQLTLKALELPPAAKQAGEAGHETPHADRGRRGRQRSSDAHYRLMCFRMRGPMILVTIRGSLCQQRMAVWNLALPPASSGSGMRPSRER